MKGWVMPDNTVSVSRPGIFGNPFKADDRCTQARAVELFEMWVNGNTERYPDLDERLNVLLRALPTLRGKNLACWCRSGTPCHAEVLIRLLNCHPQSVEIILHNATAQATTPAPSNNDHGNKQ